LHDAKCITEHSIYRAPYYCPEAQKISTMIHPCPIFSLMLPMWCS